ADAESSSGSRCDSCRRRSAKRTIYQHIAAKTRECPLEPYIISTGYYRWCYFGRVTEAYRGVGGSAGLHQEKRRWRYACKLSIGQVYGDIIGSAAAGSGRDRYLFFRPVDEREYGWCYPISRLRYCGCCTTQVGRAISYFRYQVAAGS